MACQSAELFKAYLETQDIEATLIDEEHNLLRVGAGLKNTQLAMYFQFGDDDADVHLEGRQFANIPADQVDKVYKICNMINDRFRFVKFVWDEEVNELCCRCDGVIQLDSCTEEVYELMARMASIVDEAYPQIMKALWA